MRLPFYETWSIEVPGVVPIDVAARLEGRLTSWGERGWRGSVDHRGFAVTWKVRFVQNSFGPTFYGELTETPEGTQVDVTATLDPFVAFFGLGVVVLLGRAFAFAGDALAVAIVVVGVGLLAGAAFYLGVRMQTARLEHALRGDP
ncbi:MAG: hypothetical protein AAF602_15530 [Myxococcota bacterium]